MTPVKPQRSVLTKRVKIATLPDGGSKEFLTKLGSADEYVYIVARERRDGSWTAKVGWPTHLSKYGQEYVATLPDPTVHSTLDTVEGVALCGTVLSREEANALFPTIDLPYSPRP